MEDAANANNNNNNNNKTKKVLQILTVGDGDLTLSLALCRAYGRAIEVTASTRLPDEASLRRLYSDATSVVEELQRRHHVTILYGVDATQLHQRFTDEHHQQWDLILFYHPHLGTGSSTTAVKSEVSAADEEACQARRHECLLAHYLASAASCLRTDDDDNNNGGGGRVHLCLCGRQPETWKVQQTALRLGLVPVATGRATTAAPWHTVMGLDNLQAKDGIQGLAAPRRYRSGKQGSRHWLGKYGYRHRRTQGELYNGLSNDTNVESSVDLLFAKGPTLLSPLTIPTTVSEDLTCRICLQTSRTVEEHERHMKEPVVSCDVALAKVTTAVAIKSGDNEKAVDTVHMVEDSVVRLRKYVQKAFGKSKSVAAREILAGRVSLNGEVVTDGARLVLATSRVELHKEDPERDCSVGTIGKTPALTPTISIEIVDRRLVVGTSVRVVYKPVGMRTKGHFFAGTLEALVSQQEGGGKIVYDSVSRLDTGLSGLCLLHDQTMEPPAPVRHQFTALVMGDVQDAFWAGVDIVLRTEKLRRWRKGADEGSQKADENAAQPTAHLRVVETCSIKTSESDDDNVVLSTVEIEITKNLSGIGSLLTHNLRTQLDLRVAGDRFSSREYVKLPRAIRNRIKQKICLGCTAISYQGDEWRRPVPDKWCAVFWDNFMQRSVAMNMLS
jgi:ribosomal 50S subunit-recycling heat shock protein